MKCVSIWVKFEAYLDDDEVPYGITKDMMIEQIEDDTFEVIECFEYEEE